MVLCVVQVVVVQLVGVGMGVVMYFEGVGGDGCVCFVLVYYYVVVVVLFVDCCFVVVVVWCGRQYCFGKFCMGLFWVFVYLVGDYEYYCVYVVFLQDWVCIYLVVQVVIVEGDYD